MKRNLTELAGRAHDVVIVGGGVYGLAAAWDATLRGLNVALMERGDFGHATSAASLKLIHGGLRYLQHLDIARMRVSIGERRRMMFMLPHLVHPLEFIIPCYGHAMRGPEIMRVALLLNDLISCDRNNGLDEAHRLPAGRIVSAAECLERIPGLARDGLTGGAIFYDAQMYNSERVTLSFAISAAAQGAALANYVEATGFHVRHNRIQHVTVADRLSGERFEVRGKLFINMTGPWSDITAQLLRTPDPIRRVLRSKGIQLLTRPIGGSSAFAIESRQRDRAAVLARGGRNYFVTPWRGLSYIGTTDTTFEGDPDEFRISRDDTRQFMEEINEIYPRAALTEKDIRFWTGGLRPLGEETRDAQIAKASHRYEIRDHRREGVENLISVVGVKYTICRAIAQTVVDRALAKLDEPHRPCPTRAARLPGGDIPDFNSFLADTTKRGPFPERVMRHLALNYGTDLKHILNLAQQEPALGRTIAGSDEVLRAEIVHAAREEMAHTLTDVVMRRTDLGTIGHPGRAALEECAQLMATELKWSRERANAELAEAEKVFRLL